MTLLTCPDCGEEFPEGTECYCMVSRDRARVVKEKEALQKRVYTLEWKLRRFSEVFQGFQSFHDLLSRGQIQSVPTGRVPRRLRSGEALLPGDFNELGQVIRKEGATVDAQNVQNWHRWEG